MLVRFFATPNGRQPVADYLRGLDAVRADEVYVVVAGPTMILLHAYKKQGQKAPIHEIDIARKRLKHIVGQ